MSGRPAMASGKRSRKIDARFTEEEYQLILDMEKRLGIRKTEIIRLRVLKEGTALLINAADLISGLDKAGMELGKTGSNINQLARYANTMQKRGLMPPQVLERFNLLFEKYLQNQQDLELALRKVIRGMSR